MFGYEQGLFNGKIVGQFDISDFFSDVAFDVVFDVLMIAPDYIA